MLKNRRPGVAEVLSLAIVSLVSAAALHGQPFNGTLDFDKVPGAMLEVAHDPALNPSSAMTIEAWVYIGGGAPGAEDCRSLVGKGYVSAYWLGVCGESNTLRSYAKGVASARDGGTVPANTWTHIAVTSDTTTRYHYINGELVGSFEEPDAGTPFPSNGNPVRIGNDPDWDFPPDGRIDEVRLWNVARSQADIRRMMRVALDSSQTGLISVWHLDGSGDDTIGGHDGARAGTAVFSPAPVGGFCAPSDTQLCLGNGRYAITVDWETSDATTGDAKVVPGYGNDSGLFWFFNADNWELMIKALDGCPINNRKWIFTAATTNVQYDVTVRDLWADQTVTYHNDLGVSAPAVTDTSAFATCP